MTDPAGLPGLNSAFPPTDREAWLTLVNKVLKGGDYDRKLVSRTSDGPPIEPIYGRRSDGVVIAGRTSGERWRVVTRVDHPEQTVSASQAIADLEGGAGGLALVFDDAVSARGFGMSADTVDELDAALAGTMLDLTAVRLEPATGASRNAALLAALVERRGHDPKTMQIDFGLDPIGVLAAGGSLPEAWADVGRRLAEAVGSLAARGFAGPFVTIDLRPFHEAGASEAQELATALAGCVAYARALTANGLPVAAAFAALSVTVAVDADQLMGIAKLRALRRLLAQVVTASGGAATLPVHAETAWRMLSIQDPAVNMLRSTAAVFAAATGGADSIAVLPHSAAIGLADGLSRRIARNTQIILQEESNLWRVADPGAGAGVIESLTDELAATAWKQFQDIEREGGLIASLTGGHLQQRIAATAAARAKDIATRKQPITGTSEFPNLAEASGGTVDVTRRPAPASGPAAVGIPNDFDALVQAFRTSGRRSQQVSWPAAQALTAPMLPSRRLAAPFEALRAKAEAAAAGGKRPVVCLINLGTLAEHGARAMWVANLLAAGGIATSGGGSFTSSQEAGAAFAASGARVACICGSDETYGQLAEATASAIKSAGASLVAIAGRPGPSEQALKAAGVDQFLFVGQDVLKVLAALQDATL